ncbi:hypothetical protein MKX03_030325 [Papaver bracteatum]|nr:hypothetical protein MKX03_030325 [Papaver bracteatum]
MNQGLGADKWVVSALIDMYRKCEMAHMDVGSCSALVCGLSQNGRVADALEMFR